MTAMELITYFRCFLLRANILVPPRQLRIMLKTNEPETAAVSATATTMITSSTNSKQTIRTLEPNQTLTLNEDESATLICLSEGGSYFSTNIPNPYIL